MNRKDLRHIKRRDFLISTAGLASTAVPGLVWAASKPCPPPTLSATGGTTTSASCGADVIAPGQLPVLSLTGGGANKPWTFGQAFRRGDVPTGSYIAATGPTSFQADIRNRWSDGSVKFAVLSGIGGTAVQLGTTTTAPSGALTQAQLAAALPTTTIQVGAHTTTLNNLIGTAAKHRTVYEGPVMSNWIYRQAVTGSNHLVVWADVRYYSNGAIEVFPWVENCYLNVAGPTNSGSLACSVVIGGTTKFSQSIACAHHTRIPLITGGVFSYWTGADPGITPAHDGAYLKATKLVPNYGWVPTSTYLNGRTQTYTANATGQGVEVQMAAPGQGQVNNENTAIYVASNGDARAYKAALVFGFCGGSWGIHYRDNTTNEPIRYATYPTQNLGNFPSGTGTTNGSPDTAHMPGWAFIPYLITGRWWFAEELFFWATYAYLDNGSASRGGANSIFSPLRAGSYRTSAWSLNALAQSLAIAPDSSAQMGAYPQRADWIAAWEANCAWFKTTFATVGAAYFSPQGIMGMYGSNGTSPYGTPNGVDAWFDAGFMMDYLPVVFGTAWDYGLPVSGAAQADHQAVRDHAYKFPVARAGDGSSYNWRRFIVYGYPLGADAAGSPPETWYTAAQSYAALCTGYGLNASLPATEGSSLKSHSSDSDFAASTSSNTYMASGMFALALAKDHGAPGATDSWRRISTASNFHSAVDAYFQGENVSFGVVPRA